GWCLQRLSHTNIIFVSVAVHLVRSSPRPQFTSSPCLGGTMLTAVQLTDPVTYHGEGAVWSPTWGGLRCVDMFAGDVLDIADDGSVTRRHVGDLACMIRPIDAERTLIA